MLAQVGYSLIHLHPADESCIQLAMDTLHRVRQKKGTDFLLCASLLILTETGEIFHLY